MTRSRGDIMFRSFLLITFAVHVTWGASSGLKVSKIPKESAVDSKSNSTATKAPQKICDVCACTESKVDCTGKAISQKFTDYQWPSTPLDEVLFKHNDLTHVWKFPVIKIRKLVITDNSIKAIENRAFHDIQKLSELDLSNNALTDQVLRPEEFEGKFSSVAYEPLEFLRVLNLSNNNIHSLHQGFFMHMKNLKKLTLSYNRLDKLVANTTIAINEISNLEELDLSTCMLSNIEPIWQTVKTLKRLDLSGNSFTHPPKVLDHAKKLEVLILDSNPIESIDKATGFSKSLQQLRELSMSYMSKLKTLDDGSMSNLEKLEVLRIRNCSNLMKISDRAVVQSNAKGAYWSQIKKLDLSNNGLKYIPTLLIARWDRLEELNLTNNPFSCDCENHGLVQIIIPELKNKIYGNDLNQLKCASPPAMKGLTLVSLEKTKMRCLDFYGAQPQNDAIFLVGIFFGILFAVPITLSLFAFWRKGFFFCGSRGPATYSRAFYKRTKNDEGYM